MERERESKVRDSGVYKATEGTERLKTGKHRQRETEEIM